MNKEFTAAGIALRIWFVTALLAGALLGLFILINDRSPEWFIVFLAMLGSLIASLPAFIGLLVAIYPIKQFGQNLQRRFLVLCLFQLLLCLAYGVAATFLNFFAGVVPWVSKDQFIIIGIAITALLFACSMIATWYHLKALVSYFGPYYNADTSGSTIYHQILSHTIKHNHIMEPSQPTLPAKASSNRILYKGLITAGLILLMLVPTLFISNLIEEREARQKEVVKEVSSKWATEQTLAGPFLTVPYKTTSVNSDGKTVQHVNNLVLLANNLVVNAAVEHEERPRSIYKVLLYKTAAEFSGAFKIKFPTDFDIANADFSNARLCFALTDYKGIEEEIYVNFNGEKLLLSPGLPVSGFGRSGLSVPVNLTAVNIAESIPFSMQLKIKGSEQLHFMPLSANSKFIVQSAWPSPSFDGNSLPGKRTINDKGFTAEWSYNQANLPFGTVALENAFADKDIAFGVSFVQPSDQYNKTMRSVKYGILFIGLTFAFFFIIELMQNRPFHPVQYVLVGLALVIFYTLLLSISEYILFDYAYGIAAVATIFLISLYAKGHFKSWSTAAIFFGLLSCLYTFIFILIRLEDTALLVGSIGLFAVLSMVMYASRKINWYGNSAEQLTPAPVS